MLSNVMQFRSSMESDGTDSVYEVRRVKTTQFIDDGCQVTQKSTPLSSLRIISGDKSSGRILGDSVVITIDLSNSGFHLHE
jgi:hypothetical protein